MKPEKPTGRAAKTSGVSLSRTGRDAYWRGCSPCLYGKSELPPPRRGYTAGRSGLALDGHRDTASELPRSVRLEPHVRRSEVPGFGTVSGPDRPGLLRIYEGLRTAYLDMRNCGLIGHGAKMRQLVQPIFPARLSADVVPGCTFAPGNLKVAGRKAH